MLMRRMELSETPPNHRTFNDVLTYLSKIGTPQAAERCEKILARMKQLSETHNPALKPNTFAYTIAITAWSRSCAQNAGERMLALYERMNRDNVEHDTVMFNTLIPFLANSRVPNMIDRAESLLDVMEEHKRPNIRPDHRHLIPVIRGFLGIGDIDSATRVFSRITRSCINGNTRGVKVNVIVDMMMQGFIRAGDIQRATSVVDQMQKLKDDNLLMEGPDCVTYHTLIGAWQRSLAPGKAENMQKLKGRLEAMGCPSDCY